MVKVTAKHRDLIFLLMLASMIKVALTKKQPPMNPVLYAPANTNEPNEPFFHAPDEAIMRQMDALSAQTHAILESFNGTSPEVSQLKEINDRLSCLRQKYQHTSPAIALLGPIGTTGIVLQEQHLEKELSQIARRLEALSLRA